MQQAYLFMLLENVPKNEETYTFPTRTGTSYQCMQCKTKPCHIFSTFSNSIEQNFEIFRKLTESYIIKFSLSV